MDVNPPKQGSNQMFTETQVYNEVARAFQIAVQHDYMTAAVANSTELILDSEASNGRGGRIHGRPYMFIGYGHAICHDKATTHVQGFSEYYQLRLNAIFRHRRYAFLEYRSFANQPGAGDYGTDDRMDCVRALIAHELAHVLQYNSHQPSMKGTGHDEVFVRNYRKLRALICHDKNSDFWPYTGRDVSKVKAPCDLVREICQRYPTAPRADLVRYAVMQGVNRNTAQTQVSKWKRGT